MASNAPRLHVAVKKGDEVMVKQHLKAGDDINAVDERGLTPLLVALQNEHLQKIVKILLDAGADTSVPDSTGYDALAVAAAVGITANIKALLRAGADINAANGPERGTPLMIACSAGHAGAVRLLIEEGCDIGKRAVSGTTALYEAAMKGNINIVEILLDAGTDVNETSNEGNSVLAWTAASGTAKMVVELLERGADVCIANANGFTPLHFSAFRGSVEITGVLLRAGADPSKQINSSWQTPLHAACMDSHIECVRLLLLAGSNVSATDNEGKTPLHYVLVEPGVCSVEIIELLLSAGIGVNMTNNDGNVPLFHAVHRGHVKAISLLLEAGSDVNRINKLGKNMLFGLVDLALVKLLLAKGADATIVDIFGCTVLHAAVFNNSSAGVICALFRAGADPTAGSLDGQTAAGYARSLGHTETATLLDLLADKYRETRGSVSEKVSDDVKAAKMSVAAALMEKARKILHERKAEMSVGSMDELLTEDEMGTLLKSFRSDVYACEEVKESVEECKDDQQSSSALPCLNCEAMTSRRCSGCGISYFCSKKCEMTARHVCCG